jgi:hypothetical protein
MELSAGVQVFAGPDLSQFGAQQTLVYANVDVFF